MSIDQPLGQRPLAPTPPLSWGKITDIGKNARVIRFILKDRVVTFIAEEFKRWEHEIGPRERLTLATADESVTVEGFHLTSVRAALDEGRLEELAVSAGPFGRRSGTCISDITITPVES